LLISAIPKFEFPRKSLEYKLEEDSQQDDNDTVDDKGWTFIHSLNL